MDADYPYLLATSDEPGAPAIVELPGHWSLDDWEPYNYLPGITGSGLIASPDEVVARWTLELDALVADGGLFMLTYHPFVSGRPSRAAALERLMRHATGDRRPVDRDVRRRSPPTRRRSGWRPSSTGRPSSADDDGRATWNRPGRRPGRVGWRWRRSIRWGPRSRRAPRPDAEPSSTMPATMNPTCTRCPRRP